VLVPILRAGLGMVDGIGRAAAMIVIGCGKELRRHHRRDGFMDRAWPRPAG
jgi:uracil phosphoribosyltransferase